MTVIIGQKVKRPQHIHFYRNIYANPARLQCIRSVTAKVSRSRAGFRTRPLSRLQSAPCVYLLSQCVCSKWMLSQCVWQPDASRLPPHAGTGRKRIRQRPLYGATAPRWERLPVSAESTSPRRRRPLFELLLLLWLQASDIPHVVAANLCKTSNVNGFFLTLTLTYKLHTWQTSLRPTG